MDERTRVERMEARGATGAFESPVSRAAPDEAESPDAPPRPKAAPDPKPERHEHHRPHKREKSSVLRWLHPNGVHWGSDLSAFDPGAVDHARRWIGMLFGERRYFRVHVHGWDNVPTAPTMVVSNHSGGTLIPDVWGLCYAWYTHFGTDRPIHPTAHEMVLGNRFTGSFFAKRGVVRADRRVAEKVLAQWRQDLLVMPGGDLDTWRPFTKRYQVRFSGRTGYARLALRAGVPIAPVVNAGAHNTLIVLSDGRKLAEALRLPELARASIWPVHISLPWGLALGPWPHLPPPVKLRYRFAPAIHPEDVGAVPGEDPTDEQVAELDRRVRESMQAELDVLRDEGRSR